MPMPRALSSLLLLAALSTAACQAVGMPTPTFGLDRQGRSLVVRVAPAAGAYRALYLPAADWDWAEGTLTAAGAEPLTVRADAVVDPDTQRREATLSFSELPAGGEVSLTVTLYRAGATPDDPPVEVSAETREHLAVGSGANVVTLDALYRRVGAAVPLATPVLAGLVTSLPSAGMAARLDGATDVVTDGAGTVYVLDANNGTIRRYVEDAGGRGVVTTVAGTAYPGFADGTGTVARFAYPMGMALGSDGALYVADTGNNRIRKVAIADTGVATVTTVSAVVAAGEPGAGAAAPFPAPNCVAAGPGGVLYVGDKTRIRKLTPGPTGAYTASIYAGATTAGYEDGATAKFDMVKDLALDAAGVLYAADGNNGRVRRVAASGTGTSVSTLPLPAGVSFTQPESLAFDAAGKLLVGDAARLYRYDLDVSGPPSLGVLAGGGAGFADGAGTAARFDILGGLAVDARGIWIADQRGNRLRLATGDAGVSVATRVGDGVAGKMSGLASTEAPLGRPTGVAVAPDGTIYLADPIKQQVLAIDAAGQGVTVVAGTGQAGSAEGPGASARFNGPAGVAICADGSLLVTDVGNGSLRRVRRDGAGWTVSTELTGLSYPGAVIVAPDGSAYLTESGHPSFVFFGSHRVRKVTFDAAGHASSVVLAGADTGFADGPGASARFSRPTGLALAPDGSLYVADAENHRIRKLAFGAAGEVTVSTVAGSAANGKGGTTIAAAQFDRPTGLVLDRLGRLVVTDYWNHRLQVLDFTAGTATTLVGFPGDGYSDGPVAQARFSRPVAIAQDAAGALYVADAHPWAIRKVTP